VDLNPCSAELVRANGVFRLHDKVMQIRNNYDKNVFSGDLGRISALCENGQGLEVRYDGRIVPYEAAEPDQTMITYAVSVPKSQVAQSPSMARND